MLSNAALFWSKVVADEFSDAYGNCSITAIDLTHSGYWIYSQWSQLDFAQWAESYCLSMLSKMIDFRNNIFYIEWFEEQGNYPGIIQIIINYLWEGIMFDNLYYGTNLVLK